MKPHQPPTYKVGTVAIVGRPNAGKSTLLNAFLQHKVAAVSPRPQTTRSAIHAYFEDPRGQIFFLDTPGLFRAKQGTRHHNSLINEAIQDADIIIYVLDHTRSWGAEEQQLYDVLSKTDKPIITALNKIDITEPTHMPQYLEKLKLFTAHTMEISAQRSQHVQGLINLIFDILPEGTRNTTVDTFITPLLSHTSQEYLQELIREKIYTFTTQEVPYQTRPEVLDIEDDTSRNRLKITALVHVTAERYKPMLIGQKGQKIRQISNAVRDELHIATGKRVVIKLKVTT